MPNGSFTSITEPRSDQPGGDDHHGQLRGLGDLSDGLVNLQAENFVGLGVDGVQISRETSVSEVGQDVVAEFAGRGGGADDGHAFGLENGVQAG